jgi:nucleoside 2-deoxyribosyltransferase
LTDEQKDWLATLRLYLAHPFADRQRIRALTADFEAKHAGVTLINPFYSLPRQAEMAAMDAPGSGTRSFQVNMLRDKVGPNYAQKVVERDLAAIDASDAVVAFVTDSRSIGTFMEIHYAATHGKPVFLVCESIGDRGHPWLEYFSFGQFDAWSDFVAWIDEHYSGVAC